MDASARGVLLNRQNISQCHQHYSFDNNELKQAKAPTLNDDSKQACRSDVIVLKTILTGKIPMMI